MTNIILLIDTASRPWPTSITLAATSFRSGSAWLGRSQKGGLPCCRGEELVLKRPKAIDSRSKGQPSRCPFVDGSGLATLQKERSAEEPDAEA
jgi:hypothetical protein